MIVLAIDPGIEGAWAFHYERGLPPYMDDLPIMGAKTSRQINAAQLAEDWRSLIRANGKPAAAIVEDVHAMPKQGVRSVWTFAEGHGAVLGALGAMAIPVHLVAPSAWKKAAGLGRDKGASRQRAMELWPSMATSFARVKDDGRAEAALIALHGWRQGQGS